jgi:hypothetical protein
MYESKWKLLKSKHEYGPDFNHPKTTELPVGLEFKVIDERYDPWEHMPGRGHNYYLLAWQDGNKLRCGWTRVYDYQDVNNFAIKIG